MKSIIAAVIILCAATIWSISYAEQPQNAPSPSAEENCPEGMAGWSCEIIKHHRQLGQIYQRQLNIIRKIKKKRRYGIPLKGRWPKEVPTAMTYLSWNRGPSNLIALQNFQETGRLSESASLPSDYLFPKPVAKNDPIQQVKEDEKQNWDSKTDDDAEPDKGEAMFCFSGEEYERVSERMPDEHARKILHQASEISEKDGTICVPTDRIEQIDDVVREKIAIFEDPEHGPCLNEKTVKAIDESLNQKERKIAHAIIDNKNEDCHCIFGSEPENASAKRVTYIVESEAAKNAETTKGDDKDTVCMSEEEFEAMMQKIPDNVSKNIVQSVSRKREDHVCCNVGKIESIYEGIVEKSRAGDDENASPCLPTDIYGDILSSMNSSDRKVLEAVMGGSGERTIEDCLPLPLGKPQVRKIVDAIHGASERKNGKKNEHEPDKFRNIIEKANEKERVAVTKLLAPVVIPSPGMSLTQQPRPEGPPPILPFGNTPENLYVVKAPFCKLLYKQLKEENVVIEDYEKRLQVCNDNNYLFSGYKTGKYYVRVEEYEETEYGRNEFQKMKTMLQEYGQISPSSNPEDFVVLIHGKADFQPYHYDKPVPVDFGIPTDEMVESYWTEGGWVDVPIIESKKKKQYMNNRILAWSRAYYVMKFLEDIGFLPAKEERSFKVVLRGEAIEDKPDVPRQDDPGVPENRSVSLWIIDLKGGEK